MDFEPQLRDPDAFPLVIQGLFELMAGEKIDPGEGYAERVASHITGAVTEVWPDHGHYPHLVDPDRFVNRLQEFWA